MSKVSAFVAITVALLKGDNAEATAIKNKTKATSIIENQINSQLFAKGELEDKLEEAKEKAQLALVNNGALIKSEAKEAYITSILNTEEDIRAIEAEIEANEDVTKILKAKLDEIKTKTVEVKEESKK